jgi:hypothetical protein
MIRTHIEDKGRASRAASERSKGSISLRYTWVVVFLALTVVIIFDLLSHGHPGGVHWESIPLFFLLCGLFSCLTLVVAAKLFGMLLGRSEDEDE